MRFAFHTTAACLAVLVAFGASDQASAQQQPAPAAPAAPAAKKAPAQPKTARVKKAPAAEPRAKQDVAEALKLVVAGETALRGGKLDAAVENLTAALTGGGLASSDTARALYLRGAAYRQQSKPALAIADLTSALWLKNGLKDNDRKDALDQRSAAYRDAGLPDQTAPPVRAEAPAPAVKAQPAQPGQPQPAVRVAPPVATASLAEPKPQQPSTGGVGGFFNNLFGGTTAAAAKPEPAPVVAAAPPPPQTSGWATATKPGEADKRTAAAVVPPKTRSITPPAAPAKAAAGRIAVQIASLRSRAEADAVAQRVARDNASLMAGRSIEITEAVVGSFGKLHQVRVGPFASAAESNDLCAALRKQKLDCLPVE